jgi:2'-5' RNA ligase
VRLFTGIPIPPDVTANLSRLLDTLRPCGQVRWSPVYNLHITTRFIGEWPERRLPELVDALQPLGARTSLQIPVSGLGWFPNPHSPRILFAAVHDGGGLSELAAATDAALEPLGLEREQRLYRPHLTLAKIKDASVPLAGLRQCIAALESTNFGTFAASGFSLYLSKPGPAGSIYTRLSDIRFAQ